MTSKETAESMATPASGNGVETERLTAEVQALANALEGLASGNSGVRVPEDSNNESLRRLRRALNRAADFVTEMQEVTRELTKGLSEHFDILHRLADGDLTVRIRGQSEAELIRALSEATNRTVDALSHEVAERQRAEQSASQSAALLRLVIDTTPCAISVKDAQGRYILVNEFLANLLETSPDEMVGKTDRDLVQAGRIRDDELQQTEKDERIVATTKRLQVAQDRPMRLSNGRTRYFQVMRMPFAAQDAQDCVLTVAVDVTERKQASDEKTVLAAQLRQAQKLEAIGTLAGGIAHDFNNILGAILGYTEVALYELKEWGYGSDELREVIRAANRARDLVHRIVAFSRQEDEVERKPLKLNAVVHEAVSLLRASLPSTIEIDARIPHKACVATANGSQIHQAVMNLCTNAAHAMRQKGGRLTVTLDDIELTSEENKQRPEYRPGSYLRLMVSDTGEGMSKDVMERIFDPFFTTKERGEGTGLGLAIVHGAMRAHRGHIRVNSAPAQGSTFELLLPATHRAQTTPSAGTTALPQGIETILFVDDEVPLVKLGERMLSRLGYKVVARTSSVEALEAFRNRPNEIDLVITDQTMPNMTGIELAAELLRIKPELPIILATGYSEDFLRDRSQQLGIASLAMKPYLAADLAVAVRKALDAGEKEGS